MGPLTQKIFSIIESESNIEEARGKGIYIRSQRNFIDCVYEEAGGTIGRRKENKDADFAVVSLRKHQAINDIP